MAQAAKSPRQNRTITVDFNNEATHIPSNLVVTDGLLKSEGSLALDFPLQPKARLQD